MFYTEQWTVNTVCSVRVGYVMLNAKREPIRYWINLLSSAQIIFEFDMGK